MKEKEVEVKEIKGNWFTKSFMKDGGFANLIELRKCKVAESKLKREFSSKYEKIIESMISTSSELLELRLDVANFNIQSVLMLQQKLMDLTRTTTLIKQEFKFLFDKEMKVDNDVEETLTEALGEDLASVIMKG